MNLASLRDNIKHISHKIESQWYQLSNLFYRQKKCTSFLVHYQLTLGDQFEIDLINNLL